jgi:hypothetical protein
MAPQLASCCHCSNRSCCLLLGLRPPPAVRLCLSYKAFETTQMRPVFWRERRACERLPRVRQQKPPRVRDSRGLSTHFYKMYVYRKMGSKLLNVLQAGGWGSVTNEQIRNFRPLPSFLTVPALARSSAPPFLSHFNIVSRRCAAASS